MLAGLVVHEMLSGRRAFSGNSNYEVLDAIVKKEPALLQTSPLLERITKRCLQKNPSARYQTVSEIRAVLENIADDKTPKSSSDLQPSIAVLPFVNMSGDKEQEYFSDGLSEEIINALTQIPKLKVIARTSAFAFKGKEQDVTKIAEALRVSNILEGSVRKSGDRIRITAQLIDASDGSHLWSERYDRDMTDVFAIQDEISQAIAEKLRLQMSAKRPLIRQPTEDIEAYNLYLKGHYQLQKFTAESMTKGKEYFEQAIAIDANYALSWYGLAYYYWEFGYLGFMPPREANPLCKRAIIKALENDDTLAEAHSWMAVLLTSEYDWKGADREFNRALEQNPKSADVLESYSHFYLLPMRRLDEALAVSQRALELDPLSPNRHFQVGVRYYLISEWNQAIEQFINALELDPQWHWAHMIMGATLVMMGQYDKGIHACEMAAKISQRQGSSLGVLGWAYGKAGRINEAEKVLAELRHLYQTAYVGPTSLAWTYLALGETDKGLDFIENAINEHDPFVFRFDTTPDFIALRSHPRYKALRRKMNLAP